jgi:hypothetical protein
VDTPLWEFISHILYSLASVSLIRATFSRELLLVFAIAIARTVDNVKIFVAAGEGLQYLP